MTTPATSTPSPWLTATFSYANMFTVGTFYAASALHAELPRLLGISPDWAMAPFGSACVGLSVGLSQAAALIDRHSAPRVAGRGAMLWGAAVLMTGLSLQYVSFAGVIAAFFLGGIGVGWTYLAVVIMVSQALPQSRLARSAIGPLGFSSGVAATLLLRSYAQFEKQDCQSLGWMLMLGGVVGVLVGEMTILTIAPSPSNAPTTISSIITKRFPKEATYYSILLFLNALPGMTLFASLLPLASASLSPSPEIKIEIEPKLAIRMTALATGGVLSPVLGGPRIVLLSLFVLRGLLLLLWNPDSITTTATFLLTLFAHGAGFSLLPGVIKDLCGRSRPPLPFAHVYGRVLVSWGVAGLVGCVLNVWMRSLDELAVVLGVVMLAAAGGVYFWCV
ncbi:hypothetical protein AtubIFM57258_000824 [Aspergillus tubingensis]|nr:hypothetical protein AtubIFM57258_000824 [Aspergillus tubingensis]